MTPAQAKGRIQRNAHRAGSNGATGLELLRGVDPEHTLLLWELISEGRVVRGRNGLLFRPGAERETLDAQTPHRPSPRTIRFRTFSPALRV